MPFGHLQGRAEGDVQGQGLLGMRRRLWQRLQQLNPGGQWLMASRWAERSLACWPARCQ